VLLVYLIQI